MAAYAGIQGSPSFRGAAEGCESGIQKQVSCLHLDSGPGARAPSGMTVQNAAAKKGKNASPAKNPWMSGIKPGMARQPGLCVGRSPRSVC
jgi:hypothetical protein